MREMLRNGTKITQPNPRAVDALCVKIGRDPLPPYYFTRKFAAVGQDAPIWRSFRNCRGQKMVMVGQKTISLFVPIKGE
jgi:hypothetical protein